MTRLVRTTRKPPLPLTAEDQKIWTRPTWYAYNGSFFMSRHSDRRDAYRMCQAQEIAQFGPAAIELDGDAFRGWDLTPQASRK